MGVSKVVYGTQVLIDLTEDTVSPSTLCAGYTAYDASGELIVGTNQSATVPGELSDDRFINKVIYGETDLVDLSIVTVHPGVLLEGITAHAANGEPIIGIVEEEVTGFEFPFSNESLTKDKIQFLGPPTGLEYPFSNESLSQNKLVFTG